MEVDVALTVELTANDPRFLSMLRGFQKLVPEGHIELITHIRIAQRADRAGGKGSGRAGKVNIAGYFNPAVREQLAILAAANDTDQVKLMAEALNL